MNLGTKILVLLALTKIVIPWPISGVRMTARHWHQVRHRLPYYPDPYYEVYRGDGIEANPQPRHNPDENAGLGPRDDLVEGDIKIMGPEDRARIMNARSNPWPNKNVYFDAHHRWVDIGAAIERIEFWTCVRFVPRTPDRHEYVHITADANGGCFAHVGYLDNKQPLNLGDGCWEYGVIVHELMHTLGFYHEQSRSDRDHRVTIYWDNIQGKADDFKMKPNGNLLGLSYDTYSLMHYGEFAFSKNLVSKTITTTNGETIGHRDKISWGDVYKMNRLYDCDCDVYQCGP